MKNPRDYTKVMLVAQGFSIALYLVVSVRMSSIFLCRLLVHSRCAKHERVDLSIVLTIHVFRSLCLDCSLELCVFVAPRSPPGNLIRTQGASLTLIFPSRSVLSSLTDAGIYVASPALGTAGPLIKKVYIIIHKQKQNSSLHSRFQFAASTD